MSAAVAYTTFELRRTLRNRRVVLISVGFPAVLLILVGTQNKSVTDFAGTGVSFATYYMAGMVAWGSMTAVLSGGIRIAPERAAGWVRQLRLTPLRASGYFGGKLSASYLVALVAMAVLSAVGVTVLDVRMPAGGWARMVALVLVGLVPFAALGIWLGHVLSVDAMGAALGLVGTLFALLGGAFGPIGGTTGFLHALTELLPSYWLVAAGRSAYTGQSWPAKGWAVVVVWSVAAGYLAARAYARDGARQ